MRFPDATTTSSSHFKNPFLLSAITFAILFSQYLFSLSSSSSPSLSSSLSSSSLSIYSPSSSNSCHAFQFLARNLDNDRQHILTLILYQRSGTDSPLKNQSRTHTSKAKRQRNSDRQDILSLRKDSDDGEEEADGGVREYGVEPCIEVVEGI